MWRVCNGVDELVANTAISSASRELMLMQPATAVVLGIRGAGGAANAAAGAALPCSEGDTRSLG